MPPEVNRTFDIGGPDVLTYRADDAALRRASPASHRAGIVPVPVLTPRLSSHWVQVVTPVPNRRRAARWCSPWCTRSCAPSTTSSGTCRRPPDGLIGFDGAVELALTRVRELDVSRRWSSASVPGVAPATRCRATRTGPAGRCTSTSARRWSTRHREALWGVIEGIGGENGWYSWSLGWRLRGLAGPVRGRPRAAPRPAQPLRPVRRATPSTGGGSRRSSDCRLLRLRAEMRLPGLAWLELLVDTDEQERTVFPSARCSTPAACSGTPTGPSSTRSTASCSAACSATSPPRPSRPRRRTTSRAGGRRGRPDAPPPPPPPTAAARRCHVHCDEARRPPRTRARCRRRSRWGRRRRGFARMSA